MNAHVFDFHGARLLALPSGALFWPGEGMLTVSDLHLGKSARLSSVGGAQLPPYECRETLFRLAADLDATGAERILCLGDSFDAPEMAAALPAEDRARLQRLQTGRDWLWIEGNHDPGPPAIGGAHRVEMRAGPLSFRHIATEASAEVSGHYHPKARITVRGRVLSRPCFLLDADRLILPAYGAYTGGLRTDSATLSDLMAADACAILTGSRAVALPMPRAVRA
jgi:DNA ligase-associated metallophosphoesterase